MRKRRRRTKRKYSDTSIELKVEEALKLLNVEYVKQHKVPSVVTVDFYLPVSNLIIEADGCHWHSCPIHAPNSFPKRVGIDFVRTRLMREIGYRVLRIWEHDINALTVKQLSAFISNKL